MLISSQLHTGIWIYPEGSISFVIQAIEQYLLYLILSKTHMIQSIRKIGNPLSRALFVHDIYNLRFDQWRNSLNQFRQYIRDKYKGFKDDHVPPTDKDKKYIMAVTAFISVSLLIYEIKRERAEEISLERMTQVIRQSQTDTIEVRKMRAKTKEEQGYILYFYVNGHQYYFPTKNLEATEDMIAHLETNKMLKTNIVMMLDESPVDAIKKTISICIKIVSPLVFPILLFRSSLGTLFKNNVLKRAEGVTKPNVKFTDIAGLGNAKIEISELVDFLKTPEKYKRIGAKVPKGALLAGPPGTGKTMLAKACAGEADVPFFSMSGSEFVELFAGMGAKRVRQLFENAKKITPSIIFIDQIDAIGRKRQGNFGGANDQRANTLNQLLVEMDGFGTSDDIIVLAATNRKQMLDNALTRPGRFDRIVEIDLPDLQGRRQILNIYLSKIKLEAIQTQEEYAKRLATLTFGFSGADLANLCNEAAILAVRNQRDEVSAKDFENASDRVLAGLETSTALSQKEKKRVAYHECGHAVVAWFLEGASPLLKITIIPRSKGSLGFAQYLPNESSLATKEDLEDQLCVILGGRTAQEVFFNEISNGAADDLQKVRRLARQILTSYGMSNKHLNYAPVRTDGHNIYSQATAASIDQQVIELIWRCTEKTRQLIYKHKSKIEALAEAVIKKETLNHSQIKQIVGQRPFESQQNYKEFLEEVKATETKLAYLV